MTRHLSYAEFCKNPAKYMDEVSGNRASLHIERDAGSVVLMSEDEFEGWKETIYLLQNPANADELLRGVKAADADKLEEHDPIGEQ
jgi:antitoxin YefM